MLIGQYGETLWEAEPDDWGAVTRQMWGKQPLRFQGQYFDEESGFYYNRWRYYDPKQGRYITQDPIGLAGGLNGYVYPMDPVGWVDPLGLQDIPPDIAAVMGLPPPASHPPMRPDGRPWGAGCGDAGTDALVPDRFILGKVSFGKACDAHDACYGAPGSDKLTCDDDFKKNLKTACGDKLKGIRKAVKPLCDAQASLYGAAVRNLGGSAYDTAQAETQAKAQAEMDDLIAEILARESN
jgi:RHS repeat-associated protein